MGRVFRTAVAALALAGWAGPAGAAGGTVADGPVSLVYPPTHWSAPEGPADLLGTDAGGDVLGASSWWYRLTTGDTREHRLPPPDTETYAGGVIQAHWNNVDGVGFSADETTWLVDNEGPSGSFYSQLVIFSLGGSVDLTMFHYLDLAASGSVGGDSGVQLAPNYMKFTDGASVIRYRAQYAEAFEVRPASALLDQLNDGDVDTLDNTGLPFASGHPTAAYQWHAPLTGTSGRILAVSVSSNLASDRVKGEILMPGIGFPELHFQRDTSLQGWIMRRTTRLTGYGQGVGDNQRIAGSDDFYGDYVSELLTHDQVTGQLSVGFLPVTGAPALGLAWQVAASGDLDGNGKADALWRNTSTQKLAVWLMDGRNKVGDLVPSPDQAVNANWEVVGLADFNHDGQRDFLWYNQSSGKLVIWYMDASLVRITGGFTNPASVGNNNWKALAVGDYGRGPGGLFGTPDIVWQNDTSRKVVVWYMDFAGNRTSGTFTTPDSVQTNTLEWRLAGPR